MLRLLLRLLRHPSAAPSSLGSPLSLSATLPFALKGWLVPSLSSLPWLPWLAGIWIAGTLVGRALASLGCLAAGVAWLAGFHWAFGGLGFGRLAYPAKIRVSTYCESGLASGIISPEMKHTHTQETVARINSALAARGLDPLDAEQAYFLSNPTVDPEQTEGVWEDLHRMGVEVAL